MNFLKRFRQIHTELLCKIAANNAFETIKRCCSGKVAAREKESPRTHFWGTL